MVICIYRTPAQNKQYFLENLSMIVDHFLSIYNDYTFQGTSQQIFILMKTSSRHLDQGDYIRVSHTFSEDASRFFGQNQYVCLGHTSSRRFQDILSRRLQDVLQNVFKTSSRCLQNVFKRSCKNIFMKSSRRLEKCLQDVFKTYHQGKLFLLTGVLDIFNTFLRRTTIRVICRRIYLQ